MEQYRLWNSKELHVSRRGIEMHFFFWPKQTNKKQTKKQKSQSLGQALGPSCLGHDRSALLRPCERRRAHAGVSEHGFRPMKTDLCALNLECHIALMLQKYSFLFFLTTKKT